jgi:hypothetical protein
MLQHSNTRKAWSQSQERSGPPKSSNDSIEPKDSMKRSIELCLRAAKTCEDEANYDEAESLYKHSLLIDSTNSGDF